MKRRNVGRRINRRTVQRSTAARDSGQGKREEPLSAGERRHLMQLVVCAVAFALLVGMKILLPARMEALDQRLSQAMEQNIDVRSAFHAMGRALSGEEDVADAADEVYRAVFHPEEEAEAVKTSASVALEPEERSALETLREYRRKEQPAEAAEETERVSTLAYILYSEQNLPDCVSLEQAILGFDYTSPLPGAVISSGFGYREHPAAGEERFHYGVDLATDTGRAIACFADGTVKAVGESSSYGKYCIVDHEGGYSTLYAHCSRIVVSSGSAVKRGETVAEVGETGMATGPHLHFELQQEGMYLNPVYYVSVL